MFEVDVDTPVFEVVSEGDAQLSTLVLAEAGRTDAVIRPEETADRRIPAIAQRRSKVEIGAIHAVVADLKLDETFRRVTRFAGDEIDHTTRRVGREDRGRTAADCFDPRDRFVHAERLVSIKPAETAIVLDGETVFLDGDRRISIRRDTTRSDVIRRFATRGFDPETGDRFEDLRGAERSDETEPVGVDRGRRETQLRFGECTRTDTAGDDDLFQCVGCDARRCRDGQN